MFYLVFGLFAYVVMVPLVIYATVEERYQEAWADALGRAPKALRLLSWSCFLLGSLLLPGAILCVPLMVFYLLGLTLIPSLYVAWRQLVVGRAILRRGADAPGACRTLARVAGALNGAVVVAVAWVSVAWWKTRSDLTISLFEGISAIVLVSLLQAVALRRGARLLDAIGPAKGAHP